MCNNDKLLYFSLKENTTIPPRKANQGAPDKQTNFYRAKLSNYFESTILHWLIYGILRKKQSFHYQCSGKIAIMPISSVWTYLRDSVSRYIQKKPKNFCHAFLSFICCFAGEVCSIDYLKQQLHMNELKVMNSRNFLFQVFI